FFEALNEAIAHARGQRNMLAVLFVDLDQFKYINDSLGHFVGDLLLQAVAGRLKNLLRETHTVARLGGDEFVMLVSDITRINDAARIAASIHHAIAREPYHIDGRKLSVTPSISISAYPPDSAAPVELVKTAH